MAEDKRSFKVGIDFQSVLRAISKQIYETPLAFIRENVQNAVDAVRIQALRDGLETNDDGYRIDVAVNNQIVSVRDNGIGMTVTDLENYFWTIGASGKRNPEAIKAGCVGMFGIGGFANFGICDSLEVISKNEASGEGTSTRLSEADISAAGTSIPNVHVGTSDHANPRGTLVIGHLRKAPDVNQLRNYLQDFVRYVPTAVYFNGRRISSGTFSALENRENLTPLTTADQTWIDGDLAITGKLYEDRGHTFVAAVTGLKINSQVVNLTGFLRFENGAIDAFKRGFKLCATQVGSSIGVSGRLDCDRFVPTAGRDSLDAATVSLVSRIAFALERVAVDAALQTPERLAQHTRILRYVINRGLIEKLGLLMVNLADGSESSLSDIRRRTEKGSVLVYFGLAQKQALNQVMQARGHIVVLLSSERNRQDAERQYLTKFCAAKPFDGIIDCAERYSDLTRFEKIFLSELEANIQKSYEIKNFRLLPGRLTEDIPVFVKEHISKELLEIFVDVRHSEISKLEDLGLSQVLYSLVASFCREYLGPSLKKYSPRFFGNGALNLELLAKRRSELWVLLKDDIGVVRKGGTRQVFRSSDVQVVTVGAQRQSEPANKRARILNIIDSDGSTGLGGYYLRLPDSAYAAYGDLLPECESRGVVWAGNKILYVASDTVSAAFQYEIRLDVVVVAEVDGALRAEGALELDRPLQELYDGLYFPVPKPLESFIVPLKNDEIRLELHCDWIDTRTAKQWTSRE